MEYITDFFYKNIEYLQTMFVAKNHLIRINEEEDCSEEINKLMDVIEKEIKFEKEMELLQIRYENLVKDVEDMKEDEDDNDNKKNDNNNNNNNGKISLLA